MKLKNLLPIFFISILAFQLNAQMPKVHSIGAMKDMGSAYDLHVLLDTISPKSHLYGLGPYDRMKGEITVVDGKPYFATAFVDGKHEVGTNWNISAPFFVYSYVKEWSVFQINGPFSSVSEIQIVVSRIAKENGYDLQQPFAFKIKGAFDKLTAHIVTPRNPEVEGYREGTKSQKFTFEDAKGEIIGFYSENHQGIFTNTNGYIHPHFLMKDKKFMGHLDEITTKPSSYKLYLPKRK